MSQHTHIVGAKQGRQDAFDSLYHWLLPQVYRYALAQTGDRNVAEDIVSESFMAMIRSIETLPNHDVAVLAWMRTVVRRRWVDWVRRQSLGREAMTKLSSNSRDDSVDPKLRLDRQESISQVREALDRLPNDYREVLELRYLDGFSLRDISQTLEQSVSAVNSMLFRARNALRNQLMRTSKDHDQDDSGSSGDILLVEIDHDA